MKKSFLQINQFFLLMLFSLILSFFTFDLLKESNEVQNEKLREHFKKMGIEKDFVLFFNEKFFSLLYMYCYDLANENTLKSYLKELNKDLALRLVCGNKRFEFNNFKNCKAKKDLSSYYFSLELCFL